MTVSPGYTHPVAVDVVVLGSANLDLVVRVARIPAPGETVLASRREYHPGGKGLNQAVAAARAGARTAFIGTLGEDDAAQVLLATLAEAGVRTEAVARIAGASGLALIVVQSSGENTIVVEPGANAATGSLSEVAQAMIRDGAVLVAQLEIPLEAVLAGADVARAAGRTVILNAAPARPLPDELLALVDVLVVNEHEALTLTGLDDLDRAGHRLAERVGEVIVTLGARGAVRIGRGTGTFHTPGLRADPVDTTGAGDAFVGVLASAIASGSSRSEALLLAVAAGALAVETPGAVPSIPWRSAIDARLAAAGRPSASAATAPRGMSAASDPPETGHQP